MSSFTTRSSSSFCSSSPLSARAFSDQKKEEYLFDTPSVSITNTPNSIKIQTREDGKNQMFKVVNKSPCELPTRKGNSTVKGDDDFVSWRTPSPLTTQGKIAKHAALKYGAEGIRAPYIHHPVFRL